MTGHVCQPDGPQGAGRPSEDGWRSACCSVTRTCGVAQAHPPSRDRRLGGVVLAARWTTQHQSGYGDLPGWVISRRSRTQGAGTARVASRSTLGLPVFRIGEPVYEVESACYWTRGAWPAPFSTGASHPGNVGKRGSN
jgi:hypothetical protein